MLAAAIFDAKCIGEMLSLRLSRIGEDTCPYMAGGGSQAATREIS